MRKIDHLLLKINENRRRKPREEWNYSDRNHHAGYVKEGKYGCRNCNFIVKGSHEKCPRCGQEMVRVGYVARPPRKGASKKKWDVFWNKYTGVNCDR